MVAVPVIKKKTIKNLLSFKKYKLILEYFQNQNEHSASEKKTVIKEDQFCPIM